MKLLPIKDKIMTPRLTDEEFELVNAGYVLDSNYYQDHTHPEFQYLRALYEILSHGDEKALFDSSTKNEMSDRKIKSKFGYQMRFPLSEGFPIYTTKKVFYRGAFEEMLWFIKDGGNITPLLQKNVHIWDEWAWKYFQGLTEREKDAYDYEAETKGYSTDTQEEFINFLTSTGTDFSIPLHYTNFTSWKYNKLELSKDCSGFEYTGKTLNQMNWVVTQLPKRPERKSYYVTCWNPTEAYQMAEECGRESVVIVACHTDHLVNISGGKLNLRVSIRSNDMFLGNPFNVAQYALLTHMYAFLTGYPVGDLVVNIDDAHIYSNHFEQAREQIIRKPLPLANFSIVDRGQKRMEDFVYEDFLLENYESHKPIKGDITTVGGY
jgi:thymidylate synthase